MGESHQIYVIARIQPPSGDENKKECDPKGDSKSQKATDTATGNSNAKDTANNAQSEGSKSPKMKRVYRCVAAGHHQWCYGEFQPFTYVQFRFTI